MITSTDYAGLVHEAKQRLLKCSAADEFKMLIPEADDAERMLAQRMLQDLVKYPHHFVLGCLMDRQIDYRRAWPIPYIIGSQVEVGGFEFAAYRALDLQTIQDIFVKKKLHRFNAEKMPEIFFKGIQRIADYYDGNASNIWVGNPPSARIIRKFVEFEGAGQKIATMATNILSRHFKISMTHLSAIDISPDRRVMRYFMDRGFLRAGAQTEELIYLAREINPDYPGLLDLLAFEQGGAT